MIDLEFFDEIPANPKRLSIDRKNAQEIIDQLLQNPNKWTKVPVNILVPGIDKLKNDTQIRRARGIADSIRRGDAAVFKDYPCEVQTQKNVLWIRVNLTAKQVRDLQ